LCLSGALPSVGALPGPKSVVLPIPE
jgi:hypothetical protein